MLPNTDSFTYRYDGSDIVYGCGCVERLDGVLAARNLSNVLIICGSNVGSNKNVMGALRTALGDRLIDTFDETTPAKSVETVYDGIERINNVEPDVLIGLGGGSSLDIARQISVFESDGRSLSEIRSQAQAENIGPLQSESEPLPVFVIPTTFAGADISSGGSVEVLSPSESPTGQPIRIGGSIMPEVMVYDPNLFETTPQSALEGSAMNGFDKGIETIYAKSATPVTDATASRGIKLLQNAFPELGQDGGTAMAQAVIGIILVQYKRKGSIIHAFGHGFSQRYQVQQGTIHAVMAPHVLQYLFKEIDGRRHLLAEALGRDADSMTDSDVAEAVVEEVTNIRNTFDLPTRLRDVENVRKQDFPEIAEFILDDYLMAEVPEQLEPTAEEIESVLHDAW